MSPFSDGVLQVATKAFEQCSSGTNLFVLPLFLIRVSYANVSGGAASEYTQAVKGVVLYLILIFGFGPILQILLSLPEAFLPNLDLNALGQARPTGTGEIATLSAVPSVLMWSLESIVACLFYVALFLNFAFAIVLSSIAPVVFLLGALLGIGFGLRTFFGLLIVVSSWPIVWAACNSLSSLMLPIAGGELGGVVFEIAVTLLKIAGPLAIAYFGMSSAPGQGVTTALMTSLVTGNVVSGIGHGFVQGATGSDFRHEPRPLRQGSALPQRLAHGVGSRVHSMSKQARGLVQRSSGQKASESMKAEARSLDRSPAAAASSTGPVGSNLPSSSRATQNSTSSANPGPGGHAPTGSQARERLLRATYSTASPERPGNQLFGVQRTTTASSSVTERQSRSRETQTPGRSGRTNHPRPATSDVRARVSFDRKSDERHEET